MRSYRNNIKSKANKRLGFVRKLGQFKVRKSNNNHALSFSSSLLLKVSGLSV